MPNLIRMPRCVLLLLILLGSAELFAAELVARLDRSKVVEGQAVVLTLSTSGDSSGMPDLSPLQQDFDLVNQGHSTQMRIVNGRSFSSREWHLTLLPRRTGSIAIPALRMGQVESRPLTLEVLPAAQAAELGLPQPVLVEVEADSEQVYVQQKLVYRVRLLFSAPLRDASLGEPRIDGALVYRLGDEVRSTTERDGQQYQVVERRYAVLPQRSGSLTIGGPTLNARVAEPNQRGGNLRDRLFGRDPFPDIASGLVQGRPIQLRGTDLEIEVQPPPPGSASPWLPAESLALDASWAGGSPTARVGEPLTRTIAITAQGLAGEQLPEPVLDAAGVKVYADKSRAETRAEGETLVAQRVLKAAYVPTRAGQLTLPEIRIDWWDTTSGRPAVARLPAQVLQVLPAPGGGTVQSGPAAPGSPLPAPASRADAVSDNRAAATGGGSSTGFNPWPWLALLLGLGWALSVVLWLRSRRRRPAPTAAQQPAPPPAQPAAGPRPLAALEQACLAADPHGARSALLAWAAVQWPDDPPRRLELLAARLPPAAAAVLAEIDRCLYAEGCARWDGGAAWQLIAPILRQTAAPGRQAQRAAALPALYPGQAQS